MWIFGLTDGRHVLPLADRGEYFLPRLVVSSVLFVEGHQSADVSSSGQLAHRFGVLGVVDQCRQLAVVNDNPELGRGQPSAERHQNYARLRGRKERVEKLEPVASEEPDAIAVLEAQAVEPCPCGGRGAAVHFPVAEAGPGRHLHHRRAVG